MHKIDEKKEKLLLGVVGILLIAYDIFIFNLPKAYWFILQILLLMIIHRALIDKKPLRRGEKVSILLTYLFAAGIVQALVEAVKAVV